MRAVRLSALCGESVMMYAAALRSLECCGLVRCWWWWWHNARWRGCRPLQVCWRAGVLWLHGVHSAALALTAALC
jgi:hypothetical protein